MKIIVAPDRFRGTLPAVTVAQAMGRGAVAAIDPDIPLTLVELPLSDGGEGLVDCLTAATHGRKVVTTVSGPLGDAIEAEWGLLGDGRTAVIEMAAASGRHLLPKERRKPMRASSFGTGQLIAAALDRGVQRLIVGTGGSAAIDGGIGMAQALGIHLRDAQGYEVGRGGQQLQQIAHIDLEKRHRRVERTEIIIAADVDNPFVGPQGAARAAGPQAGASQEQMATLDGGLGHLAEQLLAATGVDVTQLPGSGAGGGLAGGMVALLGAAMRRGIDLVLENVRFAEHLQQASLVLTGEGQLEVSAMRGKVATGVSRAARDRRVPCVAIVGQPGAPLEDLRPDGIDAVYSIAGDEVTVEEAMSNAADLLEERTRQAVEDFMARGNPGAANGRSR